ncbi:MAG: hypothetical protein PHC65_07485, partial [Methanobacteriaceae archaeon]|nr:hypothetical protein [Methanobacteriaceae archaeon]
LILVLVLFFYQKQSSSDKFLEITITTIATLIATFVGVYLSSNLSLKQEKRQEEKESKQIYETALILIFSELSLNITTINNILLGLKSMPFIIENLYDQYNLILQVAKGFKTSAYYALINNGSFKELSKNDDVFNSTQQAYFNLEMAINGLFISQDVFHDYLSLKEITPEIEQQAKGLMLGEIKKTEKVLDLNKKSYEIIQVELTKTGHTVINENDPKLNVKK